MENLFLKNPLQDLLSSLNVKIFEEKFLLKAPSREVRRPPLTSTKKSRQAEFQRLPLPNLSLSNVFLRNNDVHVLKKIF